eukprot:9197494-Heterocapsa_arctica.AAC.1
MECKRGSNSQAHRIETHTNSKLAGMHDWTFRRQEAEHGNHRDSRTTQKITTLQNSTERSYSYMENHQILSQYAEDSIERYNQPGSGTAHMNKNNK